jgi:hypothetical protein
LILGNKLTIEFRSSSNQNRNNNPAHRGGRGGARGGFYTSTTRGEGMSAEESTMRWGFKVIIRPIFGEPQLLYKNAINVSINDLKFE